MLASENDDKPFVNVVHERYLEFVSGNRELFPEKMARHLAEDFRTKAGQWKSASQPFELFSEVVNYIQPDRNGNFDDPFQNDPSTIEALVGTASKITMMTLLSRKSGLEQYLAIDS